MKKLSVEFELSDLGWRARFTAPHSLPEQTEGVGATIPDAARSLLENLTIQVLRLALESQSPQEQSESATPVFPAKEAHEK
jgi:hypothetical protein